MGDLGREEVGRGKGVRFGGRLFVQRSVGVESTELSSQREWAELLMLRLLRSARFRSGGAAWERRSQGRRVPKSGKRFEMVRLLYSFESSIASHRLIGPSRRLAVTTSSLCVPLSAHLFSGQDELGHRSPARRVDDLDLRRNGQEAASDLRRCHALRRREETSGERSVNVSTGPDSSLRR